MNSLQGFGWVLTNAEDSLVSHYTQAYELQYFMAQSMVARDIFDHGHFLN